MLQIAAAFVFAALLLVNPADALDAARQAIAVWATSFLPALFPFFAVTPALSSDEAARLYSKIFGRISERLFGCPGSLAGAVLIGVMAGSPAGSMAASRLRGQASGAELTRGALLSSGMSPGFLVSAVGTAMLGSPASGALLLRSYLAAVAVSGLLLRRAFSGAPNPPPAAASGPEKESALMNAAFAMISVCAHMVLFAVLARLIAYFLPAGFEPGVLALMEVSGGCAAVAAMNLTENARLLVLAFVCGFGSLSILAQNLRRLPPIGWGNYMAGKLLHGVLTVLFCGVQLALPDLAAIPVPAAASSWQTPVVLSCVMALLAAIGVSLVRKSWYNENQPKKG